MNQVFKLLKLTITEKKRLIFSFACTLFVALFTYMFVDLIQPIMDYMFRMAPQGIPEKKRFLDVILKLFNLNIDQMIKYLPWMLLIIIFGKGLFAFLSSFSMRAVGLNVSRKLRNDLYSSILYQSSGYFDGRATGELMSRLTSDVDKIQEALSGSAKDLMQEMFILSALMIGLFVKDWHLALASFVIAPLAALPLAIFSSKLKKTGRSNQSRMAHIYNLLHETITGNKIVKAFTMEKFELGKFLKATKGYLKTSMRLAWISSLSSPFMEFLGGAVGAFILLVGTDRIAKGYISAGDFGSFVMGIFLMYTPIKKISRANNVIQQGVACHERVLEVLLSKAQIAEHPHAISLPEVKGKIKFENVSFSYNKSGLVLKNIDFEVMPRQTAAFIGLSGSGKTTIINLLARFYDQTSGTIFIDDKNIQEISISSLRSHMGLVTQELILFNDTVRNNIAYGLGQTSEDEVMQAAKNAGAHEFIIRLSQGYDTQIGEGGGLLSSGQQQRLSIARAFLKNPPILILDEATSALDSESERLIQRALKKIVKNRTTLIIAHRLSTIRNADVIFVVDKGSIIESGSHRELYRNEGIYKKLYDLQLPIEIGEQY